MELTLIRHFPTQGNLEKKYVGRTDEPLAEDYLMDNIWKYRGRYEPKDRLVSSPMVRCQQTAKVLFPGQKLWLCEEIRETDFGIFEGKDYEMLKDTLEYQSWLESNGEGAIPQGESRADFLVRCRQGLEVILQDMRDAGDQSAAIVTHGGVIMALMSSYDREGLDFYEWQVKNGCGFSLHIDEEKWFSGEKYFDRIQKIEVSESKVCQ